LQHILDALRQLNVVSYCNLIETMPWYLKLVDVSLLTMQVITGNLRRYSNKMILIVNLCQW